MGDTLVLRKLAFDMIKRNNLSKAKLALSKSLSLEPALHDTYTILGDIYFLENKKNISIKYYLSSMHLLINSSIKRSTDYEFDSKLSLLDDSIKKTLPSKYAVDILNEYTISYHLGQALLTDVTYERIFKDALINKLTLDSVLHKHNVESENYLEYRNSTIIPLGRQFLITNILWDSILIDDVKSLYLE